MKTILEKFANDNVRKNGLLLLDMPTGFGKTYSIAEYIASNYQHIKGKIFFVTQLKKNLPENDLRRCFKAVNKEAELDEMLIRVENNVDCLCNNFALVKKELYKYIGDIPLLQKIEREIAILGRKDLTEDDLFLKQQAREDLQEESERALRNKISSYLAFEKTGKERRKQEKIELIKNNPEYSWIGKLYPTVYSNDKKIFIMSLDKFLLRYSTIIEPPFSIPDSQLITDGIIFIDEFDSSKDVILNRIIQNGLNNHLGIIELFRTIYARLTAETAFTKILTQESSRIQAKDNLKSPEQIIDSFKEIVEDIVEKYNLKYLHKLQEESRDKISFLFHDYRVHTIVNAKNKKIIVDADKDIQINWLKIDDNFKTDDQRDSLYSLVADLNSFLKYFQNGIGFIADNYITLKFEQKKDIYNISYESAIRTVLAEFGIEGRYQNYITTNVMLTAKRKSFDWQRIEDSLDFSIYEKGFRYYNLTDSEYYDTQSRLDYVAFNDSPEKFLLRLINRTKVVGISATATLPSVLINYDIAYLKNRCGNLYYEPSISDKIRLEKIFKKNIAKYENVNIISKPFGKENALSDFAKAIYEENANKIGEAFKRKRFFCFAQSVDEFFKHDDIKSFIFFANTTGREYIIDGENLFLKFFNEMREYTRKKAKIYFLYGAVEVFEQRKQAMLEDLKKGEKIFVVTTYGSMGAGQNIQYKYSEDLSNDLVQISESYFNIEEKDFDAIYLELPSNIIVNAGNGFDSDEAFVKYIYQMKFLQEVGDLKVLEVETRIRNAFCCKNGNMQFKHRHPKNSSHYAFAYAKVVLQAIGRICRTSNKNKNIYILYQEELADKISPTFNYFVDRMVNPEFIKLLNSCVEVKSQEDSSYGKDILKTKAENNIIQGKQIIDNLRANWTLNNTKKWEEIREFVLKYPTLPSLNNTKFPDLYFQLPKLDNKYYINNSSNNTEVFFAEQWGCQCMDENEVMLPDVMSIPGIKEFFLKCGYATTFEKNYYMLSSSILRKVYQGALGEAAGRYIIETMILNGMKLKFEGLPIENYEKFDNKIKDSLFFDFKLWSGKYDPKYEDKIENIRNKMKKTDARKVIVVNILKPKSLFVKTYLDSMQDALFVLPYLYDTEKNVFNYEGLKQLYQIIISNI
ncbi:MAG TPA: hypothetical protein P5087_01700 [Eubacteriales bacterium]|nr:hypothetical protein [Eubacteriales bacterium]